jgi:hypothetical protein
VESRLADPMRRGKSSLTRACALECVVPME